LKSIVLLGFEVRILETRIFVAPCYSSSEPPDNESLDVGGVIYSHSSHFVCFATGVVVRVEVVIMATYLRFSIGPVVAMVPAFLIFPG